MPAYNSPLDSGRPQRNPALDTDALQGLEDLDGPTDGVGDLTVTLKQARAGKTQQDTDALCTHPLFIVFSYSRGSSYFVMVSLQQVKEQTENEMSATRKAEQKHLGSTGTESDRCTWCNPRRRLPDKTMMISFVVGMFFTFCITARSHHSLPSS